MENITDDPCRVALSALGMAKTLLVDLPPGCLVCLPNIVLGCVHDVHGDRHSALSPLRLVGARRTRVRVVWLRTDSCAISSGGGGEGVEFEVEIATDHAS